MGGDKRYCHPLFPTQDDPTAGNDPRVNSATIGKLLWPKKQLLSNQFTLALGQRSACWQHGRESNSSELLSSCSEKQLYCLCVKTLNSQLLGSTWFGGWGVQLSSPWGPKVKSLKLKTWGSSHIVPCCLHFSRPLPRFPPWILLAIDSSLLSLSLVWALQGLKQRKWGWLNSGPEKA